VIGAVQALVVGGTGFVGRHAARELVDHGYDVASLDRGRHGYRFPDWLPVDRITGDRTDGAVLGDVAVGLDPDLVVDCAAYRPGEVRTATDAFADAEAYVYVSSGGVYAGQTIPKREDGTPLQDCPPGVADDESMATYGPRKAACDREAAAAADRGVAAVTVRPTMVYGPKTLPREDGSAPRTGTGTADRAVQGADTDAGRDASGSAAVPATWTDVPGLQAHHDYWIDRLRRYDCVVVPGDGTAIWHRAYVEDVASAIRTVADRGEAGEAYNVGDRRVCTMVDVLDLIADALDTSVEVVHASERELASVGLEPDDFVLYHHLGSSYPHVLETCKLAALGWQSTSVDVSMARTVAETLASGRDGSAFDPGRAAEERLVDSLTG
jgi:nucleoside-diphosphate-sugar epimerase